MTKQRLTLLVHFLICATTAYIVASIFHSQFVLHELSKVGAAVSLSARLYMTYEDLKGLVPGYAVVVLLALALGFGLINLFSRYLLPIGWWRYIAAGFLAMLTALLAMEPLMHITLIAGARSTSGTLMQGVAGALGGWVFMKLRQSVNEK